MIIGTIPHGILELALFFKEIGNVCTVINEQGIWIKLDKISTKDLQWILKHALGKVSNQNYEAKLGIEHFDKECIKSLEVNVKILSSGIYSLD